MFLGMFYPCFRPRRRERRSSRELVWIKQRSF